MKTLFALLLFPLATWAAYLPNTTIVSTNNSSTNLLSGGATYTGTWEDVTAFPAITINGAADVAGTLWADFSDDASTNLPTYRAVQLSDGTSTAFGVHGLVKVAKYFRVRLVNGSNPQTRFALTSILAGQPLITLPNNDDQLLAFSTSTLLTNGQTYSSGVLDMSDYTQVQTHILSDVNGTVTVEFCRDAGGADILRTLTVPYTGTNSGGAFSMFSAPAFTPYVRYKFTASQAGQADFYFDTKFLKKALSPQLLGVDAFISPLMVSTLGRNVIVGRTDGGVYKNVGVDSQGQMEVSIQEPRTAFGEIQTSENTPVVQVEFVHGANSNILRLSTVGTGTTIASNSVMVAATGTNSTGSAVVNSRRFLKYRPGQGAMARFTAMFSSPQSNSRQLAGIGTDENGFFFGYDTNQVFGILHRNRGVDTWTPQSQWNVDVCDGSGSSSNPSGVNLDPTKFQVMSIDFQYLGVGQVRWFIESKENGQIAQVHALKFANSNTVTHVSNPSFPLRWSATNVGNTNPVSVTAASGAAFVQGPKRDLFNKSGFSTNLTTVTAAVPAFSVKVATNLNSTTAFSMCYFKKVSFGANTGGAGSGVAVLKIVRNGTLGGSPAFIPINGTTSNNGDSIVGLSSISIDRAASSVAGGDVVYNDVVAIGNNSNVDIEDLEIFAASGDLLTVTVEATQSSTIGAGVLWSEQP